jgi:alpha-L-fucosidase
MTICQQWAWKTNDTMKSLKECIQTLALCAGGDGNLLFNVGPMPDGRIEPRQVERLQEMGAWLTKYGESIYGTRGGPWKPSQGIASTRKGNSIFVHIMRWTGDSVTLPGIPMKISRSTVLTGGKAEIKQSNENVIISVAAQDRREIDTVVKLDFDSSVMSIPPVALASNIKATASNVYQNQDDYSADKAFDSDPGTRWATDSGTHQAWVAIDLGRSKRINHVVIHEEYEGRVQKFELQYKEGREWKPFFTGTKLGKEFAQTFPTISAREVRLNILEANEGPTISEIKFSDTQ